MTSEDIKHQLIINIINNNNNKIYGSNEVQCKRVHTGTAPATNKSRQTPFCGCEVLQILIIKLTDYLKELTAWKPNAEKS